MGMGNCKRPYNSQIDDERFQRELLETHNEVRQRHGAPPLVWTAHLAELASDWATRLLDKGRMLYLDLPGGIRVKEEEGIAETGENIRLSKASESNHLPTGAEISASWAAEGRHFDFTKPRWRTGCEHFTQMIWRESVEMGASRVWAPGKNLVAIVVLYRPGGNSNLPGAFANNVLAPGTPLDFAVRRPSCSSSQSTPRHLGPHPAYLSTPAHLLLRQRHQYASAFSSPASVAGSCPAAPVARTNALPNNHASHSLTDTSDTPNPSSNPNTAP